MKVPKDSVMRWIGRRAYKPLHFGKRWSSPWGGPKFDELDPDQVTYHSAPANTDVDSLVKYVIVQMAYRSSMYASGRSQFRPGHNRTAVDIWRHVRHYDDSIDLFSVMRKLFELVDTNQIGSLVCPDISKRVFYLNSDDLQPRSQPGYLTHYSLGEYDEFRIPFSAWKGIGL